MTLLLFFREITVVEKKNENERDIVYLSYFEVRFISISVPKT